MRLIQILEEQILNENRINDVINKFAKSEQDQEIIKYLSVNDPSGNNKYLYWMAYNVIKNNNSKESVINLIKDFHQIKNKISPEVIREIFSESDIGEKVKKMLSAPTDINSYEYVNDLSKVVDLAKQMLSRHEIKKLAKNETETIYEDDTYEVLVPRTHRVSCHYGTGTKWCVTTRNDDHYFNRYTNKGVLFFILDKKMRTQPDYPLYKIAVFYSENSRNPEIYNALDKKINNTNDFLPPSIINTMETYMNKRKIVFDVIDNQLFQKTKLNITDDGWIPIDFKDLKLQNKETGSIVTFDINSKTNTINVVLSYHGVIIQKLKENLDVNFSKAITKFIDFDSQKFKITSEIQTKINSFFSDVANKVIDIFNGTLNIIKVTKILEQMIESNNNFITGDFDGNWRFKIIQMPTVSNLITEIKITWPEDPDDDILELICSINFNDDTFKFSGVLNPRTKNRADYDDEIENFDSELKNTPQELVYLFLSWIEKLMYCLMNENSDSNSECTKYIQKE